MKNKTSSVEYDISMLPKNRKEVFFDVLKLNYGKFIMFGCLMLLFSLPIHLFAIANDFYQGQLTMSLGSNPTDEQLMSVLTSIMNFNHLMNALNIIFFVILSIGLAGLSRVIRQYAWGENVDFNHDFGLGIKQNGKQIAQLSFVAGIITFICNYVNNMSSTIIEKEIYSWLGIIPSILCAIILIPMAGYAFVSISCYENRLRDNMKIGRVCYFRYLWKTLFATFICLLVFGIQLIPSIWCHLIGRIVSTILIPVIMLGWYLFALDKMDEVVNKKLHPELVGKGFYHMNATQNIENNFSEDENGRT